MTPSELFKTIVNVNYKETGNKVNYKIMINDTEKVIYLLFQKSNGKVDWKYNFAFTSKMYKNPDMICHHGFADAYRSAKNVIQKELIETVKTHSEYRIIISGWSLGGAMAVLAAEDFNFRTKTENCPNGLKPKLITFGAPKVASFNKTKKHIAKALSDDSKQYAHVFDIVTRLPPFFNFKQICKESIGRMTIFNFWKIFKPTIYHTKYDEWLKNIKKEV